MIVKRFSATKILNTNAPGFIRGRKYDTDLDRLGRMETSQRELHKEIRSLGQNTKNLTLQGEIRKEMKKEGM